jgi:hypothetical protein
MINIGEEMNKQYKLTTKQEVQLSLIKYEHPNAKIQLKYTQTTGIGTNVEVIVTEMVKGVIINHIFDITDYDSW